MENCWLFLDDQKVWAVCVDCMDKGLEREEYWVNIVPEKFPSIVQTNRVMIPLYKPLEVVKCKKCGKIIAE